jgi:Fe-S-cluster containining protein
VKANRINLSAAAAAQLCPRCGLCCDSALFADVELCAGDDAQRLRKAGLPLVKKRPGQLAFPQPCANFDGRLCRIYAGRPAQCRRFECGLMQRVAAGTLTAAAARKKISRAQRRAAQIRVLLRLLGQGDEQLALTHRYTEAMNAPVDLADVRAPARQGRLMLAVSELMLLFQQDFLSRPDEPPF